MEQYPIVYEQDLQRVLNMSNVVMCSSLTCTSYMSLSRPSKYMLCKKTTLALGLLMTYRKAVSAPHCALCNSEDVLWGYTDHMQSAWMCIFYCWVPGLGSPTCWQRGSCDMHVKAMQSSITRKGLWSVSVGFDAPDICMSP